MSIESETQHLETDYSTRSLNGQSNGHHEHENGASNHDHSSSSNPDADSSSSSYNYDTVFPSLPSTGSNLAVNDAWMNQADSKLSIKRHFTTTQIFHVPLEERRYKDSNFGNETNKKCEEIAKRLGVKVETCSSKDQTLHIVISGPEDKILEAKRTIVNELQTERDTKIKVPKEQHKYLIGKAGAVLKELQEKSCTKIQVPKSDSNSDLITITGPKDGVEQAIHEIQLIIDEQSKTGLERLEIPKLYHPWIRGFNNEVANDIAARTGAKINIPPPHVEKNEIIVSGEKEKVEQAVKEINRIYAAKSKLKITKLAIQITKSQHKLIIGRNGSNVQDIFRDFDVYVQVPKSDSTSETIYLYGEESKVGAALTQVCAKANSVVNIKIEVPSWMHRHMIGEKGANISKITADFPNTHVKFEQENKITLDGPPDEVEKVRERLENITIGLKKIMICEEINCDPRLLANKQAINLAKLNKEFNVIIRLPQENQTIVKIEGSHESVQKAKSEFLEILKKLENERSKDIIIEQKYHSNLIGKNGKHLNEIRAKFNDIQINIPNQSEKSDIVTLRGNKLEVEKCYKYLQQLIKEMQENNYQEEVQIFKEFHRIIIGKQGAFIKKVRDELGCRVDVPSEQSDSNVVTLTGKRENVLKARKLFEDKIKELVNIKEDFVEIPHQLHTALIGKGGAIIKQIRKDCGGVIINFPPENDPSDKIVIKGPLDEIKRAKQELLKLAEQKNDLSYSEEVQAKSEFHRYLVGHKGNNINALRDKFNVRILFPNKDDNNNADIITIIGKKENVKLARTELEASIKKLEEEVSDEVEVDAKWHKKFIARRAKLINQISDENCNVKISFPKQSTSNQVSLKGPKEAVEAAKKKILELAYEFENQVTLDVVVPQKYHVAIIGKNGVNSQQISDDFKVEIQFPAKSTAEAANSETNSNNESPAESVTNSPSKSDVIQITGLKENCEKAKQAILELVPVTESVPFPKKFHKDLVANKAELLIQLSNEYNIQIKVPKRDEQSADYITIEGTKENVEEARKGIEEKLNDLEAKNYSIEITNIKSELIPQLRGRNGKEAEKMEKKYQVRIDFSKKGEPDRIVIRGIKQNVEDCEAFIRKKIQEDESKVSAEITVDNRVHSRLIGYQGKALAKITEKYKVDIKFEGRTSDVVIVKGDSQEAVDDAIDHIKNLEEEYLQDVIDKEAYMHPSSKTNGDNTNSSNGQSQGFIVRGAPWEQQVVAPDTTNMDDFPTITTAVTTGASGSGGKMSWGPSRK